MTPNLLNCFMAGWSVVWLVFKVGRLFVPTYPSVWLPPSSPGIVHLCPFCTVSDSHQLISILTQLIIRLIKLIIRRIDLHKKSSRVYQGQLKN